MKRINCDGIIFDMDGVLVDVSKSYRQAIKQTVELVLQIKFGIKINVETKDIETLRRIPGFNNDWDLSFELARFLSAGIRRDRFFKEAKIVDVTIRRTNVYRQIKDIFQWFYLGDKLFRNIYRRSTPFAPQKGLIEAERALLDLNTLSLLSQRFTLGVVTSRPRFEALFALGNLNITPKFIKEEFVVAQEDSVKEKPEPDPLLEAQRRINAKNPIYIGDTINDVVAAQRAGIFCVYVGKRRLGDIQVNNINGIKEILV